jgi:uncharacterized protein
MRFQKRSFALASYFGSFLALGAAGTTPLVAQMAPPQEAPIIAVSGVGEVSVTPDKATIVLGVETRRPTAAQATAENSRTTRAVLDAVRAAGVAAEDVGTADFSVNPDIQYEPPRGTSRVVGYVVRNTVRIRVQKLENTGAVLDAALSKGSNTVQAVEFVASSLPVARREALANAVEQAKGDAEVMARAAGGTLGPLVEVSAQDFVRPAPYAMQVMGAMAKSAEAAPPISGGQQTVTARVSARWRFVPGR